MGKNEKVIILNINIKNNSYNFYNINIKIITIRIILRNEKSFFEKKKKKK